MPLDVFPAEGRSDCLTPCALADRHSLRQQPGRLPPACPEHFVTLEPSTARSVSEARTAAERAQGVEE